MIIYILDHLINFYSGVSPFPESTYLLYCLTFSGSAPVSPVVFVAFFDVSVSYSISISFSRFVSISTTSSVPGVTCTSVVLSRSAMSVALVVVSQVVAVVADTIVVVGSDFLGSVFVSF